MRKEDTMIKRMTAWLAVAFATSAGLIAFTAAPASAHEARTVGAYHFLVGWGEEPAYVGQQNSVQLILTSAAGKPVTDLGDSLKVEVLYQSQSTTLSLEPTFDPDTGLGTPGDYRAWFFPTAPGDYTFHFTGTIGSQSVDERFTSGPQTFDPVGDPTQVEFPIKNPTLTELATAIQRQSPRIDAAVAQAQAAARREASIARTLGVIGIVVGALGLVVAAAALVAGRRARRVSPAPAAAART
jgi:hypothetical protein